MARIDRQRLDASEFPAITEIQPRFSDIDILGHINNVAAAAILQEGRIHFSRAIGLVEIRGDMRPVVAALSIEYVREMNGREPISIRTGVLSVGRTSIIMGQVARQEDRCTLYAETVLVMTDKSGPAAIPEQLKAAYEAALLTPRAA